MTDFSAWTEMAYKSTIRTDLIKTDFLAIISVVLLKTTQGNYWIGTFKGLDKLDTTNNITHYSEDNKPYSLSNSSIICMMKDQQGTFWIGTYYGGSIYSIPIMKSIPTIIPMNHKKVN